MFDLFLCGDVMLGRGVDQLLPHPSKRHLYEAYADSAMVYVHLAEAVSGPMPHRVLPSYVWGDALQLLATVQPAARIVNLETAITTAETHWPKGINYRMHPDNVDCLQTAQIDCCVLANNHVLDWGFQGLADTLVTLHRAGIATSGAGGEVAQAAAPAELPLGNGTRILVFSFATPGSGVPPEWAARVNAPGVNYLPDLTPRAAARVVELAQSHRRPGDFVIASIHWGPNWGHHILSEERMFAHALIDGGFHLLHGHSSHHAKGIELYQEKLILYGCGDFINDYEGISGYETYRTDLVSLYLPRIDRATGRLVSMKMWPFQLRRFQLKRASAEDATWLHRTLARESAKLGTIIDMHADGSFIIGNDEISKCI
ncbi:MAG TPA: CapA family protein [Acidocella sp.]|nr:CapA family protein [Acidocella sp.]